MRMRPRSANFALLMLDAYRAGRPREIALGAWHLPLSFARRARVRYFNRDNTRDIAKDLELDYPRV